MSELEVAPYGGILVQSLDEEKEREDKLREQSIEVTVNNRTEVVRPEALHIIGVDSLSTDNIKGFLDYYLNYIAKAQEGEESQISYEALPLDEQVEFRVQWINDTSVNIVFKTFEDAYSALNRLSVYSKQEISSDLPDSQKMQDAIQEREAKPYSPVIDFLKKQSLSNRLGINTESEKPEEEKGMDEDESNVVLYIRLSFQSDRKVKNASAYSRYYLLHGEPERRPKYRSSRGRGERRGMQRGNKHNRTDGDEEEDLFASKLKSASKHAKRRGRKTFADDNEEEDLFAYKFKRNSDGTTRDRSRSPMRID